MTVAKGLLEGWVEKCKDYGGKKFFNVTVFKMYCKHYGQILHTTLEMYLFMSVFYFNFNAEIPETVDAKQGHIYSYIVLF